ncbi:hypothetical protein [Methylogaea oryzae]|nr:hypothetical protein [Methylogaea oryzae]
MGALAIFTVVAAMGLSMVLGVLRGRAVDGRYAMIHGAAALAGSALVIMAALAGDARLYINIAMAVVIIGLGLLMGMAARKGKRPPKVVVVAHVGLAVACYSVLAFFTLIPTAELF